MPVNVILNRCAYCGGAAGVYGSSGLYYARCTQCSKYGQYDFLGRTAAGAAEEWNVSNNQKSVMLRAELSDLGERRAKYEYEIDGHKVSLTQAGKKIGVAAERIRQVFINAKITEGTLQYRNIRISRFLRQTTKKE